MSPLKDFNSISVPGTLTCFFSLSLLLTRGEVQVWPNARFDLNLTDLTFMDQPNYLADSPARPPTNKLIHPTVQVAQHHWLLRWWQHDHLFCDWWGSPSLDSGFYDGFTSWGNFFFVLIKDFFKHVPWLLAFNLFFFLWMSYKGYNEPFTNLCRGLPYIWVSFYIRRGLQILIGPPLTDPYIQRCGEEILVLINKIPFLCWGNMAWYCSCSNYLLGNKSLVNNI